MDLLAAIRAVWRWWWLALLLLTVSVAGLFAANAALPWTYQSKANVLFLASAAGAKEVGGNPYLVFADGALSISAEAVGRTMMDDRTVARFRGAGYTSEYSVGLVKDSAIPVLEVVVTGPDPRNVQSTLNAVVAEIPKRLDVLQGYTRSPALKIRARTVAASPAPARDPIPKVRLLVVVFGLGLTLSIGVPVIAEARAERRRADAEGAPVVWPLIGSEIDERVAR
ncbi:MAG TPA: hypothetical protein VH912_05045 [Streptosporangiaceae bacterium]|jgi:hypothetical protein